MLRFFIVVGVFFSYTAFKALHIWPGRPIAAIGISVFIFAMMLGQMFLSRLASSIFGKKWFRAFAWIGSFVMASWATFVIVSLPVDLLRLVWHFRAPDFFIFVLSIGLTMLGFLQARSGPTVKRISVPIANLRSSFKGLKIAQISDLHVGPTLRKSYVERVVRLTNAENPDIVVFTGDLADGEPASIAEHLRPLRDLKTRYGAFYITGNHEYYWDAPGLIAQVKELGFTPLINENVEIKIGENKLMMAGVTDPAAEALLPEQTPNLAKAVSSSNKSDLKILLAHRPGVSVEAEPLGVDLQLSGHTHGGQFFPFNLLIGFFHKYSRGLYQLGRMWIYVNAGTGYWGPADRLGVTSEITLLTLT